MTSSLRSKLLKSDTAWILAILSIGFAIWACFIFLLPLLENSSRFHFVNTVFPQAIQPQIEQIPGVVVKEVVDGGYEYLVYVILEIDGEWTMRLNVENTREFFMTGNFRIDAINECSVHDDSFIRLEDAVSHYRLIHSECR